ncbi:MAG: VWA domain-containing protein [Candidatus Aureabacteria bacterium]|nr:VWA domain-containing protein [Candidatus Auribacterota bacterium]
MSFESPYLLFLLLLIPLYLFSYLRHRRGVALTFSAAGVLAETPRAPFLLFRHGPALLRSAAIFLLVLALARPQKGMQETRVTSEGIDIILALDVSGTMDAYDMKLDGKPASRLDAVKKVSVEFARGRPDDRIGLVVYALWAFTQCPLTLDHPVLVDFIDRMYIGMINAERTAIGLAISTAVNRLRASEAKSKVIILLTDGRNNVTRIDPLTAAQAAKALGIKIYAIGTGTRGLAPLPVRDRAGRIVGWERQAIDLDEDSLKKIAEISGGEYFRAVDTDSLVKIFRLIDAMEKTKVETVIYREYRELFMFPALCGLALALAAVVLEGTKSRVLP